MEYFSFLFYDSSQQCWKWEEIIRANNLTDYYIDKLILIKCTITVGCVGH